MERKTRVLWHRGERTAEGWTEFRTAATRIRMESEGLNEGGLSGREKGNEARVVETTSDIRKDVQKNGK